MTHQVDLHGMSISKAISKAEMVLIEASFDRNMRVEIITGKSGNMKEQIINQLLIPYKFDYYIPSYNMGMIIVTQNEL